MVGGEQIRFRSGVHRWHRDRRDRVDALAALRPCGKGISGGVS